MAEVTIHVTGVEDSPNAIDDTATGTSGRAVTIDVLRNDTSDPDGVQALTITGVTQGAAGGSVALSGSNISYTAAASFVGTDTFSYTIQDTDGLTDSAKVTVTVSAALNNRVSGIVYIDLDGDGVRDSGESGVPGAQILLTGTELSGMSVSRTVLTVDSGFYSFDELPAGTYQVSERQPMAIGDGLDSTTVPNAVTSNDVFSSISLSGGQSFAENNFGEAGLLPEYVSIVWFFASSRARNFASMFRETIAHAEEMAGHSSLAASIRVGAADAPVDDGFSPVAIDDAYAADENSGLTVDAGIGVLANDTDADGDTLTAQLVTPPANGSVTLNGNGAFTYTPDAGFSGSDSFTYQASDGMHLSNVASVAMTVTDLDVTNVFSVNENSPAGTVVGTLMPGTELGSDVVFEIVDPALDGSLELAADDHITGNPAGSVVLIEYVDFQCPVCQTYHPIVQQLEQDFSGELVVISRHFPLESFHLNAFAAAVATEAAGRQGAFDAFGDLLFEQQDAWEFAADPQPFFEDYATQLGLDLVQFRADQTDPTLADRVQRDLDAVTALGGTGTPTFFLNGERLVSNPGSLEDFAALVQVEVDATDDVFRINRETGAIIVRDSSALDFETTSSFSLAVNATGLNGAVSTITATINVVDVNESIPIANADGFPVSENGVLTVDAADGVLINDTDAGGDTLTARLVTLPANGTVTLDSDGSFTYVPGTDFIGIDSFTYQANDGTNKSPEATVTIDVGVPDVVRVRLETASLDGTPISSIAEGEPFVLNVYAADLRSTPQGVFAVYLDLFYDSSLVSLTGEPTFSADFANARSGDTSSGGLIDEIGAFTTAISSAGIAESLLASVPFKADAAGIAEFFGDPADDIPFHEVLLFGEDDAIPHNLISFDAALLEIAAQSAGEGESAGATESAAQTDGLFAAEVNWLSP